MFSKSETLFSSSVNIILYHEEPLTNFCVNVPKTIEEINPEIKRIGAIKLVLLLKIIRYESNI